MRLANTVNSSMLSATRCAVFGLPHARRIMQNSSQATISVTRPCVGIVREVYSKWERRAPLCPQHVRELTKDGVSVHVQPSKSRVFTDKEYEEAGAKMTDDLSSAHVILGVKQVPAEQLLHEKTYMFFSHTIKGQMANMPLLHECLRKKIRLIDYECITLGGKLNGKRQIAFGAWAGRAGMLNALRGIGERLLAKGYTSPFLNIGSSYMYSSFEDAKCAVQRVGEAIRSNGIHPDLAPFVVVFTSNGKASQGAQEVFSLLPHQWVHPSQLKDLPADTGHVFGCVVNVEDTAQHHLGEAFKRDEYYSHGVARYTSNFHETVAPFTSALINCTYWDERFPRLLTKQHLTEHYEKGIKKLIAVADIACDVGGSVEFLERISSVEKPFYLYDVANRCIVDSLDEDGVLMMGVDILPSELPREASMHFGEILVNLLRPLLTSDPATPYEEQGSQLPPELHGAIITNNGQFAPRFEYIQKICAERDRHSSLKKKENGHDLDILGTAEGTTCVSLHGHLFDTGLINKAFDLLEENHARFHLIHCEVHPNLRAKSISSATIEISASDRDALQEVLGRLETLLRSLPLAEASMTQVKPASSAIAPTNTMPKIMESNSAYLRNNKDAAAMSMPSDASPLYCRSFLPKRKQHVVCLGAGMVSEPLVEWLSRDSNITIQVISGVAGQAQALAQRMRRANVTGRTVDVLQDADTIQHLCSTADCVVSLLPATMHLPIAEACIRARTSLVTASYVSDEMQQLHVRAQEAGISILCEMGLDPGMDHMSAMKIIDEVKLEGGTVTSFASWCGGLPSPEAANNPLRYKFSWSPRGVLSASQNNARYLKNGDVVEVAGEELLASAVPVDFFQAFAFEALPNRDSLKYSEMYSIPEARSLYRGTLRFQGFSAIMNQFRQMGLLNTNKAVLPGSLKCPSTWRQLMQSNLVKFTGDTAWCDETLACLKYLGVFSDASLSRKRGWAVADEFCGLIESKLSYLPGERDMVAMHHKIGVTMPDGRTQTRTCSFVGYGQVDGPTIMASTVGLTAAAGAHLVLTGSLTNQGVMTPTTSQVYTPALELLRKEGIKFVEEIIGHDKTNDADPLATAFSKAHSKNADVKMPQDNSKSPLIDRNTPLFDRNTRVAHRSAVQQRIWPFVTANPHLDGHQD